MLKFLKSVAAAVATAFSAVYHSTVVRRVRRIGGKLISVCETVIVPTIGAAIALPSAVMEGLASIARPAQSAAIGVAQTAGNVSASVDNTNQRAADLERRARALAHTPSFDKWAMEPVDALAKEGARLRLLGKCIDINRLSHLDPVHAAWIFEMSTETAYAVGNTPSIALADHIYGRKRCGFLPLMSVGKKRDERLAKIKQDYEEASELMAAYTPRRAVG